MKLILKGNERVVSLLRELDISKDGSGDEWSYFQCLLASLSARFSAIALLRIPYVFGGCYALELALGRRFQSIYWRFLLSIKDAKHE